MSVRICVELLMKFVVVELSVCECVSDVFEVVVWVFLLSFLRF